MTLPVRVSIRSEVAGADEVLDISRVWWKPLCVQTDDVSGVKAVVN